MAARLALPQSWISQGPGPSLNGQTEGIGDNPVNGAIDAIALGANPSILYVGTVNGGVWKTTNATFPRPSWTPLTDLKLPALSINSLAISPTVGNTLFVGTGSTSALSCAGSPGIGVAKSTDGGNTWDVLAGDTFAGKAINSIVPTSISGGQVVLAATADKQGGVYRSTDGGGTFQRISGAQSSGLPDAGVSSLVADPGNSNRFYAAVPSGYPKSTSDPCLSPFQGSREGPGVYVSVDGGATWKMASNGIPADSLERSLRILLAVSAASSNPVYAMFIADGTGTVGLGRASGVFRSADTGATWVSMGVPAPEIFPGGQGFIHGAIAASPSDPNIVWVAGDRQQVFPGVQNENGCVDFSASVLRGDFSVLTLGFSGAVENPWSNAVCNGANGSSPHADARVMVFDVNGSLLLANDAGLSRLVFPDSPKARTWVDVGGDIQPTEIHSIAYDSLSHILLAGTQDTGTPIQSAAGSAIWGDFTKGDGGVVAVDADQTRHPGISFRYTSNYQLGGFSRTLFDSQGILLAQSQIALWIISGDGSGQRLSNVPFYAPYALNSIDPTRMLIGGAPSLYESFDRGDTLTNLGLVNNSFCAVAYGGKSGDATNPDVFYAGTGSCGPNQTVPEGPPAEDPPASAAITGVIFHRTALGGAITQLKSYPGGGVISLAINPQDFKSVFVVDDRNRVWGSFDEGATWVDLTGNLTAMTSAIRSVEVFSTGAAAGSTVLMAGTMNGVFQMRNPNPGQTGAHWSLLGEGLPHALAYDIHYDYTDHVLVAGTLGRGAWLLNNPFSQPQPADARSRTLGPRGHVPPVRPLILSPSPPLAKPRR